MSIKQYTAEELLAELANRVKPPVCVVEVTDAVAELRAQVERLRFECLGIEEQKRQAEMERDALQAKFTGGHIKHIEDSLAANKYACEKLKEERDALQARIDAGVRVWGSDGVWDVEKFTTDTHTAIVIDIQPIADHVPDANKMVDDDRKGEADRRKEIYGTRWGNGTRKLDEHGPKTLAYARSNCRRRTPGTKADRKQPERRKGERREGLEEKCSCAGKYITQCANSKTWCVYKPSGVLITNRRDPSGANERRKA